jgi:hypothetical protein
MDDFIFICHPNYQIINVYEDKSKAKQVWFDELRIIMFGWNVLMLFQKEDNLKNHILLDCLRKNLFSLHTSLGLLTDSP